MTNSSQVISNKRRSSNVLQMEKNEDKPKIIHTDKEIAKMAGVSEKIYRMEAKVLNSNNEDIKQRVLSGKHQLVLVIKNLCKFNRYKIKYYSLTIDMAKKLSMVKNRIIYV